MLAGPAETALMRPKTLKLKGKQEGPLEETLNLLPVKNPVLYLL